MAGLLARLFGKGNPNKKYEEIFFQAMKMGQSAESGLGQAAEMAVKEGAYPTVKAAVEGLDEGIRARLDPEFKAEYEKAKAKLSR